jgi:long-chain acyl-CoA synthetase
VGVYDNASAPIDRGNVADVLRAAAEHAPRDAALMGAWGTRAWAELDAAVDAGAAELSRVTPGERVVLALPNGLELSAALFATLRAGLVAVPVDPDSTDIDWVAQRVEARIVVADHVDDVIPGADILTSSQVAGWWNAEPGRPGGLAPRGGEDLALLARASRSGPPVMLSHRAILAAARVVAEAGPVNLRRTDRVLQVLPLFHVVGMVTAFLPAALAGAAVVVPDPSHSVDRAEAAVAAVRAHRVSVLPAEPTLYRQLDRIDGFERALSTVRLMTSGSSSLDPADFAAIRAATGQSVHEGYGISEAAGAVASTLMAPVARPGSAGLPYPGVEVRIGDPGADDDTHAAGDEATETDHPEDGVIPAADRAAPEGNTDFTEGITDLVEVTGPGGEVGRIAIRGVTLFSGYWPDGAGGPDEDGWFETVDIGYIDDVGELHLVDRAVETITVAGFTVYPREVEDVLVGHPLVADAAVVSMPGRGGPTVVAALVAKPGTRPTADDVSDFAAGSGLAPFKRPTDYLVIDTLPRTEVGRLDRTAVRRRFAEARGISLDEPAGASVRPIPLHGRLPGVSRAAGGARRGAHDTDEDLF